MSDSAFAEHQPRSIQAPADQEQLGMARIRSLANLSYGAKSAQ